VKILVVTEAYPSPGYPFWGSFNENSVFALAERCEAVEVLAPRPYVPPLLSLAHPRWKVYAQIAGQETRNGVPVHRPAYLSIPRVGGAFWADPGAFLCCLRTAKNMHRRVRFDAIISFDLVRAGATAWRLGRALGIPASCWATGSDMRVSASSPYGRVLARAIKHLDVVFYQSRELLGMAADLLGLAPAQMAWDRHVVLPRGIHSPPSPPAAGTRERVRGEWGVRNDQVVVLYIGRITRSKGMFELLESVSLAAVRDPRVICVLIGSLPAFDETVLIREKLEQIPGLEGRVQILPHCDPDQVWEYLRAADIFAFPSHREGMPNSLLEAMATGLPAVAFAIPPVLELEAGTGGLIAVPPFDTASLAGAILRLAASPNERNRVGRRGRARVLDRFTVQKNIVEALARVAHVVAEKGGSAAGTLPRLYGPRHR